MSANERARLAALIREGRDSLGLKQAELAELSGTTRQTISNIETAATVPQQAVLTRILDALGISPRPAVQDPDVESWTGIIGGMLQALDEPRRSRAGQAAVNAIASEIARPVADVIMFPRRDVRPLGDDDFSDEDWDADGEPLDTSLPMAAKEGAHKVDSEPFAE